MGLNLTGPYPTLIRVNYYLVIIDYFSKWVDLIPLKHTSVKSVVTKFFKKLYLNMAVLASGI